MKIAIISDTHDNLATLNQAIDWINKEKIDLLIHCGDVCSQKTLEILIKKFEKPIHLVLGNADDKNLKKTRKNVRIWGKTGEIEVAKKKISFTHFPEEAKKIIRSNKYNLVFYGHTHRPWERKKNKCRVVNPGNLAGIFYKATFAVYDTENDKLELKILERL